MISLLRSGSKAGVFDSIMNMKKYSTIEYMYENVFLKQGKKKIYIF
jgi:hypothetical protein